MWAALSSEHTLRWNKAGRTKGCKCPVDQKAKGYLNKPLIFLALGRNLTTINGVYPQHLLELFIHLCITCLPGIAPTHSRDPAHCFSANNSALFQDVVSDGDLAQRYAVFEVVAFVQLTLWNFASGAYTPHSSTLGSRKEATYHSQTLHSRPGV